MHSPFSIIESNTAWQQDMERLERKLARNLKANTPSDAVLAQIRDGRRRTPLASLTAGVANAWHAVSAKRHHTDPAPAPHR